MKKTDIAKDIVAIAHDYLDREGSPSKAREAIRADISERFPAPSDTALEVVDRAVTIANEERESGDHSHDVQTATVLDDAMSPTICAGDMIQYRAAPGFIEDGALLYVRLQNRPTLRRFYRAGAGFKLVAENKDYPVTSMRIMPHIIGIVERSGVPVKRILKQEVSRYDERRRTSKV